MPEHIQELGKLLPVYPSDEAGCRFLCVIQNAKDQPLVGKEQAAEDIKCRMRDLVCFTDFLYGIADCRAKRTPVPYSADSLRHN